MWYIIYTTTVGKDVELYTHFALFLINSVEK